MTPEGAIDYDPRFAGFLSGRRTPTLTVTGFPVTLDATRLSGTGIQLADAAGDEWITHRQMRLVPARYRVRQGLADANTTVTLGLNGRFSYDAALDVGSGGYLAGSGTTTMRFLGYPLYIDARAAGGAGIAIWPMGMPLSTSHEVLAYLLPSPRLALQVNPGVPTRARFSLAVDGTVSFDSALAPYLRLEKLDNLTSLTVLAPLTHLPQ